jgi:hypothetical protein
MAMRRRWCGSTAATAVSDVEWLDTLRTIHRALKEDGHLVFETRRPGRRIWEEWAADSRPVVLDVPDIGRVEQQMQVTKVDLPFVSLRHTYRFVGDRAVITSDSTLCFRPGAEVERSLLESGSRSRRSGMRRIGLGASTSSSRGVSPDCARYPARSRSHSSALDAWDRTEMCPSPGISHSSADGQRCASHALWALGATRSSVPWSSSVGTMISPGSKPHGAT